MAQITDPDTPFKQLDPHIQVQLDADLHCLPGARPPPPSPVLCSPRRAVCSCQQGTKQTRSGADTTELLRVFAPVKFRW